MAAGTNIASGRRGYLRYQYGTHYWIPTVEGSWTRGIIRDTARVEIPPGGLYDSADFLLHQPGVAQKRGGTSFAGPVMDSGPLAPYRAAALAFSPGAYFKFDEAAGSSTVADSSGNSNTGTVHGGVTLGQAGQVPGGSGTAALFDGTSGYITVPDAATLNPSTAFSIAFWQNFSLGIVHTVSPHQNSYHVFDKGTLAVKLLVTSSLIAPTVAVVYTMNDSAGNTIQWTSQVVPTATIANNPCFFVLTDDGTNLSLYINGTLTDSTTRAAQNASATTGFSGVSSNTAYIGSLGGLFINFFPGILDEFAVFKNVTLSAANVTALWGDRFNTVTSAQAVAYTEFPAGARLVSVGSNNQLYEVTAATTTSLGGQAVGGGCVDRPKLRVGGSQHLLVVPCADGTSVPVVYNGSAAPVNLGGSPPAMKFIEIYKGYLVGGNNNASPTRLFFSPALDITSTWDTANSWINTSHTITGLAALQSALLVFSQGHVEKITGSTPPPNTDMQLIPIGDEGCLDARSIVVSGDTCIYANSRGVWLTNGIGFQSLTDAGGIETYWRELLAGYDSSWSIAGGLFGNFYFVTVIDGSGDTTTLMCNIPTRAWWPVTNFNAVMYSRAVGKSEELYYADALAPRVVQVSGIFSPSADNKLDADGTAVQPMLETRALGDGPDLKAIGGGHVLFDMRDAAQDDPTMTVLYARGTEASSFEACAESPFAETLDASRQRFTVGGDGQAVSMRLQQVGASSKTEVYALEVELRPYPAAAEGQ